MFSGVSANIKANPKLASAAFGSLGGGLASLFSGYENPYDKAQPYYEQAARDLPQYFNPSIQAGQRAIPQLEGAYGAMLDPNALIKKIGAGYQESPGYQFARNQGLTGINNASAAGGMLGSPQHQQEAGTLATNLANQDFYNYLKQALGLYGQGAAGEQSLFNTGTASGIGLGEDLASILASQAKAATQGQTAQNEHEQGGLGSLFGGLGSLLPFFLS
jgi:hypothetical protein